MISKTRRLKKNVEISKYRFEKPSNFATRTKKGLHDPSREGLMIVFVLQNTRGNTRDTTESGWHIWHHRIRDWQLVSKVCYFSRVNMYNIDSRCHHPRISVSYFSTGVISISMIVQIIEKWVVLQALWSPLRGIDTRTKIKPKITLDFKVRLAAGALSMSRHRALKRLVWSRVVKRRTGPELETSRCRFFRN